MQAIKSPAIITSIRSKTDRSLGLTISTPELTSDQKVVFMNLQGINVDMVISPRDVYESGVEQVEKDVGHKTQSQRIRAVLYKVWEFENTKISFDDFYHKETERIIERLKLRLN